MRENKYSGIVLKKQPFGEADEIISFYTRQAGKIRLLAKSIKKPGSKLQNFLQLAFCVNIRSTQSGRLPRVISSEVTHTFASLRESLEKAAAVFSGLELVLRFTPDHDPNPELYHHLSEFLVFVDRLHPDSVTACLCKFKIEFLRTSGLPVQSNIGGKSPVYFSPAQGGFVPEAVGKSVKPQVWALFLRLQETPWASVGEITGEAKELSGLLSDFIAFQMERGLLSEKIFPANVL
jgi:DNA repair protein RecO